MASGEFNNGWGYLFVMPGLGLPEGWGVIQARQ
jgi:hypothetical protein